MAKTSELVPALKAEGYKLLLKDELSDEYNVAIGNEVIGVISVQLKCVKVYTGTEILYAPYDLDIVIVEGPDDMPIDLFKKMIKAAVTLS